MKKLKLNLDEIKVESFAIPNEKEKIGTVLGAEEPCDTVGSGACGGGGGNQTYETQCGTCPAGTCALTCANTWCDSCVLPCNTNPVYNNTCAASCYTLCMC